MDKLEEGLRVQTTESKQDIQRRLGNAPKEIQYGKKEGNFDKVFVNGDPVKTFKLLVKAVQQDIAQGKCIEHAEVHGNY
jgi:guanylate kinase